MIAKPKNEKKKEQDDEQAKSHDRASHRRAPRGKAVFEDLTAEESAKEVARLIYALMRHGLRGAIDFTSVSK